MQIVTRTENPPEVQSFEPYARAKIKPGEPVCFPYHVIAEPGEGQSKRGVILSPRPDYSRWEVLCDEGTGLRQRSDGRDRHMNGAYRNPTHQLRAPRLAREDTAANDIRNTGR